MSGGGGASLELQAVCKSYGAVRVADAITLQVPAGEALGVLGPNGAGKSTLFNLIGGAAAPDSGSIRLDGQRLDRLSPEARCRRGVARSFQIPRPFGGTTVFENLLVGAAFGAGLHDGARDAWCVEVLQLTGLLDRANVLAGSLGLLERKRLELARALAAKPRLLLLDEIAGGLTDAECRELVGCIRAVRATGVTVVWVEHVLHALLGVVDRLVVLDFGRIIADGAPRAVMADPVVRDVYLGLDSHDLAA